MMDEPGFAPEDESPALSAGLYVVATPIGNLEDITLRALRVLKSAGLIAAEDTRHSLRLLRHYGIKGTLVSYHEHNERASGEKLLGALERGERVALICDAGTPGISDPGYRLVRAAREANIPVHAVPGPSAPVAALSVSGLPTGSFTYHGFFPRKGGEQKRILDRLRMEAGVHIFFESPKRFTRTIGLLATELPEAEACAVRELTKIHEEVKAGSLAELNQLASTFPERGEYVLLIHVLPASCSPRCDAETLARMVEEAMAKSGLSRRDAIRQVSKEFGVPRNQVYSASCLDP